MVIARREPSLLRSMRLIEQCESLLLVLDEDARALFVRARRQLLDKRPYDDIFEAACAMRRASLALRKALDDAER